MTTMGRRKSQGGQGVESLQNLEWDNNVPQIFKEYRWKFNETRHFRWKIPFFSEEEPGPLLGPVSGGPHSSP